MEDFLFYLIVIKDPHIYANFWDNNVIIMSQRHYDVMYPLVLYQ